ncbi:MAG: ISAzo13 family transposase [Candidatus Ozemobacteraceae bacterium]
METEQLIRMRFKEIAWALDERLRRLFAAAEAKALGYGGVSMASKATGVSRRAIHAGIAELAAKRIGGVTFSDGKMRKQGGGRKKITEENPSLIKALDGLVEPDTLGDPESPLRWTCKSLRLLAQELQARGHPISHQAVGKLLHDLGYSLQGNKKTLEGGEHEDRDAQFEYINFQVKKRLTIGKPVISVDTKKKELVGSFKNNGKAYRPKGNPEAVNVYDFIDPELGRANPYGIYDIGKNTGWVSVGTDHDTASFAVETIRRWWNVAGKLAYPKAAELMITADGGGSNGSRVRLWKAELQRLANETGLCIRVSHFPPGTSKWNKIEHRLFSHISMNWRGKPLVSHEVIVNLIAATTTKKGLRVHAELDQNEYPKGIKVPDDDFERLNIRRDKFHGEWNYSIRPGEK